MLIILLGSGLAGAAIFAYPLGLARDPAWGRGQSVLLALGGLIFLAGLAALFWPALARSWRRIEAIVRCSPLYTRLGTLRADLAQSPAGAAISRFKTTPPARYWRLHLPVLNSILTLLLMALVLVTYLWLVSVGYWKDWPATTDYYHRLALAFRQGQVYLPDQPDPALLDLQDPYDPEMRGSVPVIWDLSLFNGKYYLYWGPTPALVLAVLYTLLPGPIGDAQLVFGFVSGIFILNVLILTHVRQQFYPRLPAWAFCLAVLVMGMANPLPWLLNRPAVYEAAIASGQFFLLGGIVFFFTASSQPKPSPWRLAAAGACWIGAVGARTSLVFAVWLLVVLAVLAVILSKARVYRIRQRLLAVFCLGLPLALGALGIGWYNWARFGSPLDFGHRYQITGMDLNHIYDQVFSLANMLPNLHNYLLNPFTRLEVFPFIKPDWGGKGMLLMLPTPPNYYSEQITGLLPGVPFVLFALLPLVWLVRGSPGIRPHLRRVIISLAGAFFLAFIFNLGYLVVTMRYLADFLPCLLLLAVVGFWQAHHSLVRRPFWQGVIALLGIYLAFSTLRVGFLLAVTGYQARFENLNPALFDQLTRFFAW
jgi:hypothetical protein